MTEDHSTPSATNQLRRADPTAIADPAHQEPAGFSTPQTPEVSLFRPEVMLAKRHQRLWGELALPRTPVRWLLMALAIFILVFLYTVARYGSYTRAEQTTGVLYPDTGEVRVAANLLGTVRKLHAGLGDQVVQGQPLITLGTVQNPHYDPDLEATLAAAIKHLDDSLALLDKRKLQEKLYLTEEVTLLELQMSSLTREKVVLAKKRNLANLQLARGESLALAGNISPQQKERLVQETFEHEQHLEQLLRTEHSLRQSLAHSQFQLIGLPDKYQSERLALEQDKARYRKNQIDYFRAKDQTLVAEMDGEITAVNTHLGGLTEPGKVLMVISPLERELQAVLFLPPRSGGFLNLDQKVELHVSAFPHAQFGTVPGRVSSYTRTVLLPGEAPYRSTGSSPVYKVVVALEKQSLDGFHLRSGMDVTAHIALESRAVWEWMVAPVLRWRQRLAL